MTVRIGPRGARIALNNRRELAQRLDETILLFPSQENTESILQKRCTIAGKESIRAVCVRPEHVHLAKGFLEGTSTRVAAVIGCPPSSLDFDQEYQSPTLGQMSIETKVNQARQAILDGADEIDIIMDMSVFNRAKHTSGDDPMQYEMAFLQEASLDLPIKIIVESQLLSQEDLARATTAALNAGASMIQIGTDLFSAQQGDLVQSIQLVRKTLQGALVQPIPWVKAVGGIHTIKVVLQCLENGADILGCQNCKDLLDQFESHYESTFQ